MQKFRILLVCMGNICRSPTAEGVLQAMADRRQLSDQLTLDSAGTHGYHIGKPPDPRAVKAAAARQYDISMLRSRCLEREDFNRFDLILAADRQNLRDMQALRAQGADNGTAQLRMMLDFLPADSPLAVIDEVPDPYYGGASGFERVLDLLELSCQGVLDSYERGDFRKHAGD